MKKMKRQPITFKLFENYLELLIIYTNVLKSNLMVQPQKLGSCTVWN
jgi:hypothetical protein